MLSVKDIETIPVPNVDNNTQEEIGKAFVKADEELNQIIKEAREKHSQEYHNLYEQIGLASAFKSIEK